MVLVKINEIGLKIKCCFSENEVLEQILPFNTNFLHSLHYTLLFFLETLSLNSRDFNKILNWVLLIDFIKCGEPKAFVLHGFSREMGSL